MRSGMMGRIDPQAPGLAGVEKFFQMRADPFAPGLRTDDHGSLTADIVARPQPVQGEPIARHLGHAQSKGAGLPQYLLYQCRRCRQIEQGLLHTTNPADHFE